MTGSRRVSEPVKCSKYDVLNLLTVNFSGSWESQMLRTNEVAIQVFS